MYLYQGNRANYNYTVAIYHGYVKGIQPKNILYNLFLWNGWWKGVLKIELSFDQRYCNIQYHVTMVTYYVI